MPHKVVENPFPALHNVFPTWSEVNIVEDVQNKDQGTVPGTAAKNQDENCDQACKIVKRRQVHSNPRHNWLCPRDELHLTEAGDDDCQDVHSHQSGSETLLAMVSFAEKVPETINHRRVVYRVQRNVEQRRLLH